MAIELTPEAKKPAVASIKRFINEQWDLEIGDLKADLLLDFINKELGPIYYNKAVADAQGFLRERAEDLGAIFYQKEFSYWAPRKK